MDFFVFVKDKQQIQKNRRLMDFTKEQLSEVLCKQAKERIVSAESTSKCNVTTKD